MNDHAPTVVPEKSQADHLLLSIMVLTFVGILFFPRITFENAAKLRLEDIAFLFMTLIIFMRWSVGKFRMNRPMSVPFLYLLYPFTTSFLRALTVPGESFHFAFFWGKSLQYMVFFAVTCYLFRTKYKQSFLTSVLLFLVFLNACAGMVFAILKIKGYYGIAAIFFEYSASLSGQVYFSCCLIALLARYLNLIKSRNSLILINFLIIICAVFCLATGSKSVSFGLIAFFIIFYFVRDLCREALAPLWLKLLKWLVLSALMISTGLLLKHAGLQFGFLDLRRLRNPIESTMLRYTVDLLPKLDKMHNPIDTLFGLGYLAGQPQPGKVIYTSAFDSQYIRNILVLGIIGSLFWLWMLLYYARFLFKKDLKLFSFYCALLGSYLIMGVGLESFQLSKSGAIFWILLGILVGLATQTAGATTKEVHT